jgi:glycosyltransferase involved in cell wall biosynthesis
MKKISVIIPTFNNAEVLPTFFKELKKQTYGEVEYVVSDGGSSDSTLDIARKNGARVVRNPKKMAEPGVRIGMKKAKGELLIVMAIDNFFYDKDAFKKIAEVFKDERIVAAFPKQDSLKKDNLYTKYRNTFSDPVSHYIYGYATNGRTFSKYYDIKYKGNSYKVYDYKSRRIYPLIAFAQGFIIRKGYVKSSFTYDDIRPVFDLIDHSKDIAYIHGVSLYHHTYKGMFDFMKKIRWPTRNFLEKKNMGINTRSGLLPTYAKIKMFLWPLYSISIVFPAIRALWGIIDEKENMWLFHPAICFVSGIASIVEFISFSADRLKGI